ncbi:protein GOLM2-like isoform X2 [Periplaneta americana]|uniref:protein GOLM2-like isoform X2 n=1 Tax=Periplaneta americana TaxID=6978 RepID=UPI0037E739AB
MSLDSMRGSYGRCPPFLVAGLLVVCIILTFNWWSLSSQNYDLIKQLEELGEQLKISSEEQDLCVHQRLSVEGRVKTLEEEMAQLRVRLEQQRAENDDMKKVLETRDDELKEFKKEHDKEHKSATLCNTELDSLKKLQVSMEGTIQTLKLEKSQFTSQLDEQKQEIQQLRQDLEQARAALDAAASKAVKQPVFSVPNKLSTAAHLRAGELREVTKVHVMVPGLKGMVHRWGVPILPQDPPDAVRPPPRFSVIHL